MARKRQETARDPKSCLIYCRVSTEEQAKGMSVPGQLDRLREFARRDGLTVDREYTDAGKSGRDDKRPGFQTMLRDVLSDSSRSGVILVRWTSRFMRNVLLSRLWKDRLKKQGVRVLSSDQQFPDDPTGRLSEGMAELIDEFESEVNAGRTRAGMVQTAREGYFPNGLTPFGFKVERVPGPYGGTKNKLAVHATEADTVREAFALYVGGSGAKAVAADLNARGRLYRGRPWTLDLVLRVIGETAVVGTYYWGRTDSRTRAERPRSEWIPIPVEGEPVIDRELFSLAQDVRARRDPGRNAGREPSSPLLLAGLLVCGRCGAKFQLETARNGSGATVRYYNCRSFHRGGVGTCPGRRIREEVLDLAVLRHVTDQLFTIDRCRDILREYIDDQGALRKQQDQRRRQLEREHADLERRLRAWYEKIETETALAAAGAERIRELIEKRDEVARTLASGRAPAIAPYLFKPEIVARFRDKVTRVLTDSNPGLAKAWLNRLIDRIVVHEDELVIEAKEGAIVAMMSDPDQPAAGTTETVHTDVVVGRPRQESNL